MYDRGSLVKAVAQARRKRYASGLGGRGPKFKDKKVNVRGVSIRGGSGRKYMGSRRVHNRYGYPVWW